MVQFANFFLSTITNYNIKEATVYYPKIERPKTYRLTSKKEVSIGWLDDWVDDYVFLFETYCFLCGPIWKCINNSNITPTDFDGTFLLERSKFRVVWWELKLFFLVKILYCRLEQFMWELIVISLEMLYFVGLMVYQYCFCRETQGVICKSGQ